MSEKPPVSTEGKSLLRTLFPKIILIVPYIALLWIPFYNDVKPSFLGFPFFYWYQLLWVPITSLILFIVYQGGE